jgi:hypothetical protein
MPIFQHGKNTRVLFANPIYTSGTFYATFANGSSTLTVIDARSPLTVGTTVSATGYLASTTITNVTGSPTTGYTVTVAGTTSASALTPTAVVSSYPNGVVFDASQYINDVSVSKSVEASETTAFQTGGIKSYIVGLKEGTISLSGFYENSLSGTEMFLKEALSDRIIGDKAILVFPDGGTALSVNGTTNADFRCSMAQGVQTKYDIKSPVAGVVAVNAEITADGGVWNGVGQYIPSSLLTGAGTYYTKSSLQGTTSSNGGGQLQLGVTSLAGTTPTISVQFQHSQDNSTWVNLANPLSSLGASVQVLSGTIYKYTRLAVTLGGTTPSATIYYGFARY